MENRIIYLSKAKKEFDISINYYEEKSKGLGLRFEQSVKQKLESISKFPERYSNKTFYLRQATIYEFPFLLIYRYYKIKNLIVIHSVFHTSRKPKYKYRK